MAIQEKYGLLTYKDAAGNTNLLYPITRLESVDGAEDLVHFDTEQSLTDVQKEQARTNIGAAPKATVEGETLIF